MNIHGKLEQMAQKKVLRATSDIEGIGRSHCPILEGALRSRMPAWRETTQVQGAEGVTVMGMQGPLEVVGDETGLLGCLGNSSLHLRQRMSAARSRGILTD